MKTTKVSLFITKMLNLLKIFFNRLEKFTCLDCELGSFYREVKPPYKQLGVGRDA
jgi:hypothetical protein